MKLKAIVAILAVLALSVTCTAIAFAETGSTPDEIPVLEDIPQEAPAETPEEIPSESPEAEENDDDEMVISDKYSPETPIVLIDDLNYDFDHENCTSFVGSVSDISKYAGQEFYYPEYGMDDYYCGFITVLYNQRYYAAHGDKTESGKYNNLQFNVMGDIIERFWIDINYTNSFYEEMPEDMFYESHGTEFLIRKNTWAESHGDYYVKGALDGCTYSFTTNSIENAKLVIDSLVKQ